MVAISKHFKSDPASPGNVFDTRTGKWLDINETETRILVYEDLVNYWFLQVAKYLKLFVGKKFVVDNEEFDTNEAGFVILQIAVSYIEGKQQYVIGNDKIDGSSKAVFKRGLRDIFNVSEGEAKEFYCQVRCGLFHDGITKKKAVLHNDFEPLEFTNDFIKISPNKFLAVIEKDFFSYLDKLRSGKDRELVENFNKMWEQKH